jgi:hypothetical protein
MHATSMTPSPRPKKPWPLRPLTTLTEQCVSTASETGSLIDTQGQATYKTNILHQTPSYSLANAQHRSRCRASMAPARLFEFLAPVATGIEHTALRRRLLASFLASAVASCPVMTSSAISDRPQALLQRHAPCPSERRCWRSAP